MAIGWDVVLVNGVVDYLLRRILVMGDMRRWVGGDGTVALCVAAIIVMFSDVDVAAADTAVACDLGYRWT